MKKILLGILLAVAAIFGGYLAVSAATLPNQVVYFTSEDFSLDKAQKDELTVLAESLEEPSSVSIIGYVQRSTEENKNRGPERLSEKRAKAVANFLASEHKRLFKNEPELVIIEEGRGQPEFNFWLSESRRVDIFVSPLN